MPLNKKKDKHLELYYYREQKRKAFIALNWILILTIVVIALLNLIDYQKYKTFFWVSVVSLIYPLSVLILVKKVDYTILAKITVFLFLGISIITLNILPNDPIQVLSKYYRGFYQLFGILVITFLFCSNYVVIFVFITSLVITGRVMIFGLTHFPEYKEQYIIGYAYFFMIFTAVTFIVIFAKKFTDKIIYFLNQQRAKVSSQNEYLERLIATMKKLTQNLLQTADQLEKLSVKISEISNSQASFSDELTTASSSLEDFASGNLKNAQQAEVLIKKVSEQIIEGTDIFDQTILSVQQISKKIKLINEIADKTDILSINAAIEAAHTQQNSYGFTIVAAEMKKLAQYTLDSALEITALSEKTEALSVKTQKKLSALVPQIAHATKMMQQVVRNSLQQKQDIFEMNKLAQDIAENINKNAAIADELLKYSAKLMDIVKSINELIKK